MNLPSINNRELLPLRFVPFVIGFMPAPHSLVRLLAHDQGLAFPAFRQEDELFAYHLDTEGVPARMLPMEWKTLAEDMIILEKQLRIQETFEDEKYRPWRLEALKLLPARVFVWKDEFESVFQASFNRNGQIYSENANVGTKELIFNPLIEPQYLPLVWEGFESLRLESPTANQTNQVKNREGVEMRLKILVSFADFIRLFAITDLEHWELGLRVAPDGVWVVPTQVNYLFPEELASINEHPEKDLTKVALPFPCSLSQLESFIEWDGFSGYLDPTDLDNFIQKEIGKLLSAENKCSGKTVKSSITGSRRNDLLSEEITAAIDELGGDRTPKKVMIKLKEYAGKEGSCILAAIPVGITWLARLGVKKDLDLEGLRKRLARKAAVKPPLGR